MRTRDIPAGHVIEINVPHSVTGDIAAYNDTLELLELHTHIACTMTLDDFSTANEGVEITIKISGETVRAFADEQTRLRIRRDYPMHADEILHAMKLQ